MHIFGTTCFAYEVRKKKLDDRCKKGVFLGYDKGSPAYIVYYPEENKISKHCTVRFTDKFEVEASVHNKKDLVPAIMEDDFPGVVVDISLSLF